MPSALQNDTIKSIHQSLENEIPPRSVYFCGFRVVLLIKSSPQWLVSPSESNSSVFFVTGAGLTVIDGREGPHAVWTDKEEEEESTQSMKKGSKIGWDGEARTLLRKTESGNGRIAREHSGYFREKTKGVVHTLA